MYAMRVAQQKTDYRIVYSLIKTHYHAQRQRLTTLYDFHAGLCCVSYFGARSLTLA